MKYLVRLCFTTVIAFSSYATTHHRVTPAANLDEQDQKNRGEEIDSDAPETIETVAAEATGVAKAATENTSTNQPYPSWPRWFHQKRKHTRVVPVTKIPNAKKIVENLDREGTINQLIINADIPNPKLSEPLPFLGNRPKKSGLLREASKENVKERLVSGIDRCISNSFTLFSSQPNGIRTLKENCTKFQLRQEQQILNDIRNELLHLQHIDRLKSKRSSSVHPAPTNNF